MKKQSVYTLEDYSTRLKKAVGLYRIRNGIDPMPPMGSYPSDPYKKSAEYIAYMYGVTTEELVTELILTALEE